MSVRNVGALLLLLFSAHASCQSLGHSERQWAGYAAERQNSPKPAPHTQDSSEEACPATTSVSATGLTQEALQVGSQRRTYLRYLSPQYDSHKKHTLILGYHGLGLDGSSPRRDHKWTQIEEMAGDDAIFLYPNAQGGRWDGSAGSPDIKFFDALVQTMIKDFCVDPHRVVVHGFSNGSFFVNALLAQRSQVIQGLMSVAGGGAATRKPVMIIHGLYDNNVGYNPYAYQTVAAYAAVNGCKQPVDFGALTLDQCQVLEACPQEFPVVFCPWRGNHHWPEFTLPAVWDFVQHLP